MADLQFIKDQLAEMRFIEIKFYKQNENDLYFTAFDEMELENVQLKVSHDGNVYVKYKDNVTWGERISEIKLD